MEERSGLGLSGDGLVVDDVRNAFGRLHSGDVGVDENGLDAFLFERLDRLGARIIKLAGLADLESTGAEDEDLGQSEK